MLEFEFSIIYAYWAWSFNLLQLGVYPLGLQGGAFCGIICRIVTYGTQGMSLY